MADSKCSGHLTVTKGLIDMFEMSSVPVKFIARDHLNHLRSYFR